MTISRKRSVGVLAFALVFGLGAGGAVMAFSAEGSAPSGDSQVTLEDIRMPDGRGYMDLTTTPWPTNEYGLTVGTPTEADRVAQNLPDLTPRKTDDGKEGFIIARDFYLPNPKNPDEAVAQTAGLLNEKGEHIVDVYRADGKTKIGTKFITKVTMNEED